MHRHDEICDSQMVDSDRARAKPYPKLAHSSVLPASTRKLRIVQLDRRRARAWDSCTFHTRVPTSLAAITQLHHLILPAPEEWCLATRVLISNHSEIRSIRCTTSARALTASNLVHIAQSYSVYSEHGLPCASVARLRGLGAILARRINAKDQTCMRQRRRIFDSLIARGQMLDSDSAAGV